jgi:putative transposase
LKKQFNAIKYEEFPWMKDIHRDAHSQPFANLSKAVNDYFADLKNHKKPHKPQTKKKEKTRDSFYIANDKFQLDGKRIKIPKIGWVAMTETLRFDGKIMSATVSRQADRWLVSIQVEVAPPHETRKRKAYRIDGADLGIKTAVVLSSGEGIESPKPLKAALRRLQIRQRRVSRKLEAAKKQAGITGKLPKGTRLPVSNNRRKASMKVAKVHMRIANIRNDFTHKTTTRLMSENQAIGIEDLNVSGMTKNHKLARALSDVGFGEFRRQMEYKAVLYHTTIVLADRFYPSSKTCSVCEYKLPKLELKTREWDCPQCGTHHDRDTNAARNLKRLATETALPVANQPVMADPSLRVSDTLAMAGK